MLVFFSNLEKKRSGSAVETGRTERKRENKVVGPKDLKHLMLPNN